jgi:prevent-host-death family protein
MYNKYVHNIRNNIMSVLETNMSKLRANLADALNQASMGDVVIVKRPGKPDAALVDSELLEDYLASVNPRLIKKVTKARAEFKRGEIIDFEDMFKQIMG